MRISDFLSNVGRAVSYHPAMARVIGVKETVFLCQLFHWHGKQRDAQGWFYKTQAELLEETGLSEEEQLTVRRNLRSKGLLEERHDRLNHRMFYRLVFNAVDSVFAHLGNPGMPSPESGNAGLGNPGVSGSTNTALDDLHKSTHKKANELFPVEETKKTRPKTMEEVTAFCKSIGLPESDGEWFWYKCEGIGWKNGGQAIKDWKSTIRAWKLNNYLPSQKPQQRRVGGEHKEIVEGIKSKTLVIP